MLRIIALGLFILLSFSGFTQNTSIKGKVLDARTGEELIGVNVVIEGTKIGASTELDGIFEIKNVQPGTVVLVASFIGYETQKVTLSVKPEGPTNTIIRLKEQSVMLEGATITVDKVTATENALVLETKEARQVVSGISRQQITKSQDRDAAQAMARIPGVTVVENRFVMIRGVSERYNSVMINNVVAPSTEVDKRTFSFDLISSSAIDRMMIYKSGSPELPGDFAGGVIKIFTNNSVSKDFTEVNFSVGYRNGTTFNPYLQSEGHFTDFLGFGGGSTRRLSRNFPTTDQLASSGRNNPLRQEAGRMLNNNFVANESVALPDYNLGVAFGRKYTVNGKELTGLTTVNFSQSYQYFQRDFFRYFEWEDRTRPVLQRFAFLDDTHQRDNKVSIMSNWSYRYSPNTRLRFSNFFTQIGENETIIRNGEDFIQRPGDDLRNYLLGYRSRSVYSGQLEGVHDLTDKSQVTWVVGGSYLGEAEPDLRRFRTYRPRTFSEDQGFIMQLPPSSNLFETGRYFGSLNEFSVNNGLDYTYTFGESLGNKQQIKTGYYIDYRSRRFDSRYFSYLYPGFSDPVIGDSLSRLPLDVIFSEDNISVNNGFVIEEGTRPIDAYNASNFLTAAYGAIFYPIGLFNFSGGLRLEYNIQRMDSRDDFSKIEVVRPILSVLPFVNGSYNFDEKNLIRLSGGRTVNRPEFRELAPFMFYDYKLEAARFGNPNLTTATIDNVDIRYEYYPRMGETISFGVFGKYFRNPIENRTIITTEQPNFTFINADFAYNYGAELEIRKSFQGLGMGKFVDRLSINANASYIFSVVDLGEAAIAQERTRPLQGQSPYIINAGLFYSDEQAKFDVALSYNIFGPRIFSVGDVLFPTIFELERHSIDATISKTLANGLMIKVGVQDILNFPFRFYQDTDRSETVTADDDPIFTFRRGQLVTCSIKLSLDRLFP
jgi:hypothetical protein